MQGWNVYRPGTGQRRKLIDTVFYDDDRSKEYVRQGLIEHDGYPADIEVEKSRIGKAE